MATPRGVNTDSAITPSSLVTCSQSSDPANPNLKVLRLRKKR